MNIEKQKKTWRITQDYKGKRYRVTIDHKPTKAEAMRLISAEMEHPTASVGASFASAADAYITTKNNVLSPCTVRSYRNILKKLPESLLTSHLSDITALDVQKVINDLSVTLSPKTLQNYSSFIMSVLKAQDIDIKAPRLPQKQKRDVYIPSEDDVRRIFEAADGTEYAIPLRLAALGLRRSEICAAGLPDLDGDVLRIDKALVPNDAGEYVVKTTKTTDSTRDIPLPHQLAEDIRAQGYIYRGNPNSITKALYRMQDDLGIRRFSVHKLRHFFASFMHGKFTDAQIQAMGGWKTDTVLRRIYTHALDMDKAKKDMSDAIGALF